MKFALMTLLVVCNLSSLHAGLFEDLKWDDGMRIFASKHYDAGHFDDPEKQKELIQRCAHWIYEDMEHEGPGGKISLTHYFGFLIDVEYAERDTFFADMKTHFPAAFEGFNVADKMAATPHKVKIRDTTLTQQ